MSKPVDNRAWLLVSPAVLLMAFIGLVPLVTVINYSFHDIFALPEKYWVGFEWYAELIASERFHESFARSLCFSLLVISIQFPIGILVALSLPRSGMFVPVFLVIFALPLLVPWNMIPVMWLSLFNQDTGVLANFLERSLSLRVDWKLNPYHTWLLIVMMDVWHWTSLVAILCYSSLTTVPAEYYRAAAIDSARRWQVFLYIELPGMRQVLLMALLLRVMDSFMIYTEAFGINAGGPRNATMFLAMDLGEEIKAFNYGPSAARSVVYFLIVVTIAWAFKVALSSRDRQE